MPQDPDSKTNAPESQMECGATSDEIPGFGYLYCELRPGHDGPHREREDGLVWADDDWAAPPIPLVASTAGSLRAPDDVGRYVRFLLSERGTETLIDGRVVRADQAARATRLILDNHEAIFWITSDHPIAVGP